MGTRAGKAVKAPRVVLMTATIRRVRQASRNGFVNTSVLPRRVGSRCCQSNLRGGARGLETFGRLCKSSRESEAPRGLEPKKDSSSPFLAGRQQAWGMDRSGGRRSGWKSEAGEETRSGLRRGLRTPIRPAFVPPHPNGSCRSNWDGM